MVVGNAPVVELIDRAVNHNRLSHAYLFYGEKGLGKKAVAAFFAKAILCKGSSRPCGTCTSCVKWEAGAHPDVTMLSGTAEKNELTVANIRKLKADSSVYPNDGDKKVYLISDCQKMQAPAANALLKLLEEPPEHVVILLTADDRSHVLPTILSRCIPAGVFPVSVEECAEALAAMTDAGREAAEKAAVISGGNIGQALEYLSAEEETNSLDEFCRFAAKHQSYEMLKELTGLAANKAAYREFLVQLIGRFRNAAVLKAGRKAASDETAAVLMNGFTAKQLLKNIRLLAQTVKEVDANANMQVLSTWVVGSLME